ncbi:MAG: glycerol-3-phosphate 1-O-acyltransferase PlsY [Steroidobacteraceae bacterium]
MIELILKVSASYLLGSILGSLLIARMTGRADIRAVGSGNPGTTNALRTQGKLFALGVVLVDVGKGWVATRVVPGLWLNLRPPPIPIHSWLPAVCGAAVMLGHVYPLWYGFRGGKAVATFVGAVLGLMPRLVIPVLLTWIGVVVLTGFVGLASMAAAVSLPLCIAWTGLAGYRPFLVFGLFAAVLIVLTHRANIARMCTGREPRARRLWLFGRRAVSRT